MLFMGLDDEDRFETSRFEYAQPPDLSPRASDSNLDGDQEPEHAPNSPRVLDILPPLSDGAPVYFAQAGDRIYRMSDKERRIYRINFACLSVVTAGIALVGGLVYRASASDSLPEICRTFSDLSGLVSG